MKVTRNIGMLLLAIWLILTGLIPLLNFSFSGLGTLMAVLAIADGRVVDFGRTTPDTTVVLLAPTETLTAVAPGYVPVKVTDLPPG